MVQIEISLAGEKQMSRNLMVSAAALKDFKAPLDESAAMLQKTFQMNFDERGELFGGWAPRKRAVSWPLLEKTGDMRNQFRTDSRGVDTVVLSNAATYFKYHQLGTRKMPARTMMKIDQARRTLIQKIFQAHIMRATKVLK